jgi:hypothetical protein
VLQHLVVQRGGQRTEQEVRLSSIETLEGKLLEFESEIQQGAAPLRTTGRVVGDRLELETTIQDKTEASSIPWSAEYRGPHAPVETLRRKPMVPGEQRTIHALAPVFNLVVTHEMTAKDYQPVELLTGTEELLRIDTVMRLPDGQSFPMVAWSNRMGEILKTRTEAMTMEEFRATKDLALKEPELGKLDMVTDMAVKVDTPLIRAHETKQIRYRIHLEGADPAKMFATGPSQQIEPIDSNEIELTVYAIRPGRPDGNPRFPKDLPTDADRQPNSLIQSDDPKIVAMARKATGDRQDPWQISIALERYVNQLMTKVDFSRAFATAAEVAENPVGDCTEHAVLLAALARARGIPARVAIGLVYMQGSQSFGYHMWTEVYSYRRWIPIDATLAKGGIGAAHLKLAHSSLEGTSGYSSFLPVVQVIGRLAIHIEEVE